MVVSSTRIVTTRPTLRPPDVLEVCCRIPAANQQSHYHGYCEVFQRGSLTGEALEAWFEGIYPPTVRRRRGSPLLTRCVGWDEVSWKEEGVLES